MRRGPGKGSRLEEAPRLDDELIVFHQHLSNFPCKGSFSPGPDPSHPTLYYVTFLSCPSPTTVT